MHHYLYLTTNLLTYQFYVGLHSNAKQPCDDIYLGSGKYLTASIKKFGREAFHRRIIRFFDTREDLIAAEKAHITKEFLTLPGCMNLTTGGMTDRDYAPRTGWKHSEATKKKMSENRIGMIFSDAHRKHIGDVQRGKKQSPELIEKRASQIRGKPMPKVSIANKGRKITWDCNSDKSIQTRRDRHDLTKLSENAAITNLINRGFACPYPKPADWVDKPIRTFRSVLSDEMKQLYKLALLETPSINRLGNLSWTDIATRVGVNPRRLLDYAKGSYLYELD